MSSCVSAPHSPSPLHHSPHAASSQFWKELPSILLRAVRASDRLHRIITAGAGRGLARGLARRRRRGARRRLVNTRRGTATPPSASSGHSETNILGLVAIKLRPVRDEHAPFDFEYDACVETRESRPGTRGARDKAQSESGQTLKMGRAEGRIAPNYQTVILEQPRGNRQSALHRLRARRAVVGDLGRRVLVRRARRRDDARRLEGRRRLPR